MEMCIEGRFFLSLRMRISRSSHVVAQGLNLSNHVSRTLKRCGEIFRFFVLVSQGSFNPATHRARGFPVRSLIPPDCRRVIQSDAEGDFTILFCDFTCGTQFFCRNRTLPQNTQTIRRGHLYLVRLQPNCGLLHYQLVVISLRIIEANQAVM